MYPFAFNVDFPDATNEQKWDQIAYFQQLELAATDWTQLPDSPADKASWATYRQQIRDLQNQTNNADDVVFPVRPA